MIDLKKISKNTIAPPRIVIYGPPGVGKTTFAAMSENPIFILIEEGLGDLDVPAIPIDETGKPRVATSFNEVIDCFAALGEQEHDYKTVVIDSLDALEQLIWASTCRRMGYASIEAPGWGKGYREANTEWKEFFDCVSALRDDKGMTIIMIAHSTYTHIDDPERPAYDTNTLNIHKYAIPIIVGTVDIVGFATQKIYTKADDIAGKKDDKRIRAIAGAERELRLSISPAFTAKNRYHMPEVVPLDWEEFEKHLPGYVAPTATSNQLTNATVPTAEQTTKKSSKKGVN